MGPATPNPRLRRSVRASPTPADPRAPHTAPHRSIVGAVVGATVVGTAFSCLNWSFDGGLSAIIASWFISPVLSGAIGVAMFLLTYTLIIRSAHSASRSLRAMPILYGTTTAGLCMLILIKSKPLKHLNLGLKVLIAAVLGAAVGVAARLLLVPLVTRRMGGAHWLSADADDAKKGDGAAMEMVGAGGAPAHKLSDAWAVPDASDLDTAVDGDAEAMMATPKCASASAAAAGDAPAPGGAPAAQPAQPAAVPFQYLLVFVAAWESFGHGANDTANATGAFAALYTTYRSGFSASACEAQATPVWVMAVAGAFVFIGMVRADATPTAQVRSRRDRN